MYFLIKPFATDTYSYHSELEFDNFEAKVKEFANRSYYNDDTIRCEADWGHKFSFRHKPTFFKSRFGRNGTLVMNILLANVGCDIELQVRARFSSWMPAVMAIVFGLGIIFYNWHYDVEGFKFFVLGMLLIIFVPLSIICDNNFSKSNLVEDVAKTFNLKRIE